MEQSRKRRIVRRAVKALVATIAAFGAYVSSFLAINLTCPSPIWDMAVNSWFYQPLMTYEFSDHPGHVEFRTLSTWCMNRCQISLWKTYESERWRNRNREINFFRGVLDAEDDVVLLPDP